MPDQPELSAIMDDLAYSDDKFGPVSRDADLSLLTT